MGKFTDTMKKHRRVVLDDFILYMTRNPYISQVEALEYLERGIKHRLAALGRYGEDAEGEADPEA